MVFGRHLVPYLIRTLKVKIILYIGLYVLSTTACQAAEPSEANVQPFSDESCVSDLVCATAVHQHEFSVNAIDIFNYLMGKKDPDLDNLPCTPYPLCLAGKDQVASSEVHSTLDYE